MKGEATAAVGAIQNAFSLTDDSQFKVEMHSQRLDGLISLLSKIHITGLPEFFRLFSAESAALCTKMWKRALDHLVFRAALYGYCQTASALLAYLESRLGKLKLSRASYEELVALFILLCVAIESVIHLVTMVGFLICDVGTCSP